MYTHATLHSLPSAAKTTLPSIYIKIRCSKVGETLVFHQLNISKCLKGIKEFTEIKLHKCWRLQLLYFLIINKLLITLSTELFLSLQIPPPFRKVDHIKKFTKIQVSPGPQTKNNDSLEWIKRHIPASTPHEERFPLDSTCPVRKRNNRNIHDQFNG